MVILYCSNCQNSLFCMILGLSWQQGNSAWHVDGVNETNSRQIYIQMVGVRSDTAAAHLCHHRSAGSPIGMRQKPAPTESLGVVAWPTASMNLWPSSCVTFCGKYISSSAGTSIHSGS